MGLLVNPYRFGAGGLPSISSQYWRVRVLGAEDAWVDIAEVELASTIGGTKLSFNSVLNNGSFTNSGNMIDANNATYGEWHGLNGALNIGPTFNMGSSQVVKEVRIRVGNTFTSRGPLAIAVDTFDIGTGTYTPVFWGINRTPYTANSLKTFTLAVIPTTQATTPFWSLNVTETNNPGFNGFSEFSVRSSSGGSNLSQGMVAFASGTVGYIDANYGLPVYAVDGTTNSFYYSSTGAAGVYKTRYQVTHETAPNPTHFILKARPSFTADTPKDFTLDYSLDGCLTWTTAKTVTGATGWANSEVREYAL